MTTSSLDAIRVFFSKFMIAALWVMAIVVVAIGVLDGEVSPLLLAPAAFALAAAATFAWRTDPSGDVTRWLSTIALCGQVALLVFAAKHSAFQMDMHMAFFAALAIAAGWVCMTSILLGATVVAVHHLVLNFVYPLAVFPDSSNFGRVVVHAVILVAEAGALAWLCSRVAAAFAAADAATLAARESEKEVRLLGQERSALQADVEASHALAEERIISVVGDVVQAARDGDFSRRAVVSAELGRLGTLVEGVNEINASVDRATAEFLQVLGAVAGGDLSAGVATSFAGRFGELGAAINQTVDRLSETVATIQTTAMDVGASAREIEAGADDLSRRTEHQASSLADTAATTEELAASVKASAQSSRQAVDLAEQAMQVATDGGGIVREAVEAMARIEQASQKISDISSVIDEIAFQTNLLALNAAVEAARAGEAGKGFAVVASEVRTLAQRSSEAAKDITGLITTSNTEVAQGVRLVHAAGDALSNIVSASKKVSATVSEISQASGEQANGIDEMSQAVAQMDQMTQQNAAMAEESAASAKSLTEQIARLNELVALFRTNRAAARAPAARHQAPAARYQAPAARYQAPAARYQAPAAKSHAPAAKSPAPKVAEPNRLRQLAADAFSGKPAEKRKPVAAASQGRATRSAGGWDEF